MPATHPPTASDPEQLDRCYREGGLRVMASPHVHDDDALCPHSGRHHAMEWTMPREPIVSSNFPTTGTVARIA